MSLRVLLADESDTIKKVFQLALQDLNAEIKSVHSGLDVLDVAQSFKPDIIFADVLIQKKNGYDTCQEIKQNPQLGKTPVVLMWSSFMELDQEQFKKSKADDQLEKPFDADFLRELIKKHVPQTQANPMAQFLNFPKSITAELKKSDLGIAAAMPLAENPAKEDTSEFNIASFLDEAAASLPPPANEAPSAAPAPEEAWASADLSKFKLDLDAPADNLEKFEALNLGERSAVTSASKVIPSESVIQLPASMPAAPSLPSSAPATDSANVSGSLDQMLKFESVSEVRPGTETKTRHRDTPPPPENTGSKRIKTIGMSDDEIEAIIRAHTEEIIKTQIRDTLHDIIERIVRDELSKLLDEEVRLKQDMSSDNA